MGCLLLLHSHPIILANCMISSASPASHHEWESKASLVEYIAADRITCTDSLSLSLSLPPSLIPLSYVGFCSSGPSETGFPRIHVKRYLYPRCRVRNISFGAYFSAASCTRAHTTHPQSPHAFSSGSLLLNTSSISPSLSLVILHSLSRRKQGNLRGQQRLSLSLKPQAPLTNETLGPFD